MPTARTIGRSAATSSSERIVSRVVMILRISTIAPSSFGPLRVLYRAPSTRRDENWWTKWMLWMRFLINA
jgi:hypothetical protein